jgi:hypothetical protein
METKDGNFKNDLLENINVSPVDHPPTHKESDQHFLTAKEVREHLIKLCKGSSVTILSNEEYHKKYGSNKSTYEVTFFPKALPNKK